MYRDNFEQPEQRFSPEVRRVPTDAAAVQPNAQNAPARVLWDIEVALGFWLLGAFLVELLFVAAR